MLERFSLGTGDRFGQEGVAQLQAIQRALKEHNLTITPVWNKSHREHQIIGTGPLNVQEEADLSVKELGWDGIYCIDADHITKEIVDPYISCSNFFTIDLAEYIGEPSSPGAKKQFIDRNKELAGSLRIPGIEAEFNVNEQFLSGWADQYLLAIHKALELYDYIRGRRSQPTVFEISMDEVETPQTPVELFFILKALSDAGVKPNTIAPKFTGDFYKGVDYVGDIDQFETEFEQDLKVIAFLVDRYDLPSDLKLSVHSGSDKFSLYPRINTLLEKHNAGVHLKTSGTTWLEELIGLAESGEDGLAMVKNIYREAHGRYEELTGPYRTVIHIEEEELPVPDRFSTWNGKQIVSKLEHDPGNPDFDSQLRQFMHCAYKLAAEQGDLFIRLLQENRDQIAERVTGNLFYRHICPLFLGKEHTANPNFSQRVIE